MLLKSEICEIFSTTGSHSSEVAAIREKAQELAMQMSKLCVSGNRELDQAILMLQSAVMWAEAGERRARRNQHPLRMPVAPKSASS